MKLFDFFRSAKREPSFTEDFHTHLLPGVDDGVSSEEKMICLIHAMHKRGVNHIHFTPHCYHPLYPNTFETIEPVFRSHLPRLQQQFPQMQFTLGGELRISAELLEAIERGDRLPIFGNNCLLLENSLVECSEYLEPIQFALQARGYHLVMAHPERYPYYHQDIKKYAELREQGWQFQLNLSSKAGRYGDRVVSLVRKLERAGYVDFYGSDLHGERHLQYI